MAMKPGPYWKKKKDVRFRDQDVCWTIDSNEDFWNNWEESRDNCSCHSYYLEQYHIIECGHTIECKSSYELVYMNNLVITPPEYSNPHLCRTTLLHQILSRSQKQSCHVVSNIDIEDKESSYNYEVVLAYHQFGYEIGSSNAPALLFRTGEILLDESDEDFKTDTFVEIEGMELLLLETSGP
ncbi:MAG: hypothetical protein EXX96DRAFT_533964 [Benjaminiella poitrasii]|nr:MAG: hypothetical protein EXX96DRAFT_533964 [Benjaminiella poitrasii]